MAKIIEYPEVKTLVDENVFLLDGPDGTKTIRTDDLTEEIQKRMENGSGSLAFVTQMFVISLPESKEEIWQILKNNYSMFGESSNIPIMIHTTDGRLGAGESDGMYIGSIYHHNGNVTADLTNMWNVAQKLSFYTNFWQDDPPINIKYIDEANLQSRVDRINRDLGGFTIKAGIGDEVKDANDCIMGIYQANSSTSNAPFTFWHTIIATSFRNGWTQQIALPWSSRETRIAYRNNDGSSTSWSSWRYINFS